MLLLPRVRISADFLSSALVRSENDTEMDRRLLLVELSFAAWGLVSARPSQGTPLSVPLSPFCGIPISQLCEQHKEFEGNIDDLLTLQALQDSAVAVVMGGVPPGSHECNAYLREFVRIFRPYIRDHLLLGFRDILSVRAVELLDAIPKVEVRKLDPLPQDAAQTLARNIQGSPSAQVLTSYSNFTDCINLLAQQYGIQAGYFKDTTSRLAHARNVSEGRTSKEIKSLVVIRSRAQKRPDEITQTEADGYLRHVHAVLRAFGYSTGGERA